MIVQITTFIQVSHHHFDRSHVVVEVMTQFGMDAGVSRFIHGDM